MLKEADFLAWCTRLALTETARAAVAVVRSQNPARRVGGGRRNVSGRYPSRKMGATIQFESHRVELPFVYEMEHDPEVLEYYDQPPSIPLAYKAGNGRRLSVLHTPDYFVLRHDSAGWEECKTADELEKLAVKSPNRYRRGNKGNWCYPPGEQYASEDGLMTTVKRRPGASPLLFGKYLMNMAAFVSLEDISDALPAYTEEVLAVEMDPALQKAYADLEQSITDALREHHGNASVISTAMNALLLYPDRPYGLGTLYGYCTNEETGERERFVIAEPADLDQEFVYAKERSVIEEVKRELAQGRRVQVFAVYTRKRDVTRRLQELLLKAGIRAEVLTAETPPEQREAWYERHLRNGMQVCICHPKLVQTGLDLLEFPTILFYETGYSTYVLRQASRRSWRIGQKRPVRVGFLTYSKTAQESCLRLMGKKLLVSLAMEGKLQAEGLQAMDEDDDLLTAMARELVTRQGVGERAAEIWKTIQIQQSETSHPSNPAVLDPESILADETGTDKPAHWIESDSPAVQLSLF